jgi:TetR/AcrR family transcriptional regulator
MPFSETASLALPGAHWRERALDRSLEEPRARSVDRLDRLVGAARDLANESESAAFTVAQVAERAGSSLKSFYRCFASKDELLLALLEDDTSIGASIMQARVDAAGDRPADRLHAYFVGLFEMITLPGALGYAGVLVREHRRLSEEHHEALDAAIDPLVRLLVVEIARASDAGVIDTPDPEADAHAAFTLVLAGIHDVTLGRAEPLERADHVWRFVWRGLGGRPLTEGTSDGNR